MLSVGSDDVIVAVVDPNANLVLGRVFPGSVPGGRTGGGKVPVP
tara:strand:+ start:454 stop:585 length:132 start_codon:yes stop_codon:yes gene_type:complete